MSHVIIDLAFPPKGLSPNDHVNHFTRAGIAASYRNACKIDALNAKRAAEAKGVTFPLQAPVRMHVIFGLKSLNVRRDWTNLIAAFKAGEDGIVDAGIIEDDRIQIIHDVHYEVSKAVKPGVLVELECAL